MITFTITEQNVEQYAYVSGDFNPIHLDLEKANQHGFSNKIVHGMLSMAKIWSVISEEFLSPKDMCYQYEISFLAPVYVGAQIVLTFSQIDLGYQFEGKSNGKAVVKGFLLLSPK
jgi:3-hydroxybutyryl-CoA dehydratase